MGYTLIQIFFIGSFVWSKVLTRDVTVISLHTGYLINPLKDLILMGLIRLILFGQKDATISRFVIVFSDDRGTILGGWSKFIYQVVYHLSSLFVGISFTLAVVFTFYEMITSCFLIKILLELFDLVFHHFDFASDLSCRLNRFYGHYFFFRFDCDSIGGHFAFWRLVELRSTTKTGLRMVSFDHSRILHDWVPNDCGILRNIVRNHGHRSKWVLVQVGGRMDQAVHIVWIHHVVSEFKLFLMSGVLNLWLITSIDFILD